MSRVIKPTLVDLIVEGLFVNGAEFVLADTAEWANPVFGEFFEWSAWINAVVGVAYCGIILVAAYVTYILFHDGWGLIKGFVIRGVKGE